MMTPHSRYLAFVLAGGFFVLVSISIAAIVVHGLSTLENGYDRSTDSQSTRSVGYVAWRAELQDPQVEPVDPHGGRLIATVGDREVQLPTLKTDYQVDVRGDLIAVQLTQKFENPGEVPLDATYQFPLHEDAAVHAVTMRVGDEVIRAVIQEEDEAQKTYEAAKEEGKVAALTEQHRPNLFQQSIANLMPGQPVEVELRYVHAAERRDGRFHFTLPLVVGPRFSPADISGNALVAGSGDDEELPAHPPVQQLDAPESIDHDRVGLTVRIDAGLPLGLIDSRTHEIDVQRLGTSDARIGLTQGRTIDNRHFELSYSVSGEETRTGLVADYDLDKKRGYFSLLVEPPAGAAEDLATAREMVFVLDCSGSMNGQPMDASKAFMRRALRSLRPTDTFRVIRFSDGATEYSRQPIEATPDNVSAALEYVDELEGSGGTVMSSGIEQALGAPTSEGAVRLVTFLTDGYIGNEFEIVKLLRSEVGEARLFAIGVGTGVNRYLIEEMARTGRGFARYVDPTEDVDAIAAELTERLKTPVLTDIRLETGSLSVDRLSPAAIPDLFAGQSVRIAGTYTTPGVHTMTVHGKVAGRPVKLPLIVALPAEHTDGDAVRLMWARAQIADKMHLLNTPGELREVAATDDELQSEVTRLGLNHSLVTQWTSFVAVSDALVNTDRSGTREAQVPVSQVAAVPASAYASPSVRSGRFSGGATPEPGIIGGLLMTLVAAGGALRRRKNRD